MFNLYANPAIPAKPEESDRDLSRSMLNLFFENEQAKDSQPQGLSRGVFNLSQNI
jgi:hypothetical protein